MVETGVLKLQGVVQHYDWGGYDFIPDLLGIDNPTRQPFAELWIGAHAKAPSLAEVDGVQEPLDELIAEAPEAILGSAANARFEGRLPYLQDSRCAPDALHSSAPYPAAGQGGFRAGKRRRHKPYRKRQKL